MNAFAQEHPSADSAIADVIEAASTALDYLAVMDLALRDQIHGLTVAECRAVNTLVRQATAQAGMARDCAAMAKAQLGRAP